MCVMLTVQCYILTYFGTNILVRDPRWRTFCITTDKQHGKSYILYVKDSFRTNSERKERYPRLQSRSDYMYTHGLILMHNEQSTFYCQSEHCIWAVSSYLLCLLTESSDTTEFINGEQRPGWYFAHAQDDLNLRILRMFDDTFLLYAAHI